MLGAGHANNSTETVLEVKERCAMRTKNKVMQGKDSPLVKVMACLLDEKKRSGRTEASFGPLHDTVSN